MISSPSSSLRDVHEGVDSSEVLFPGIVDMDDGLRPFPPFDGVSTTTTTTSTAAVNAADINGDNSKRNLRNLVTVSLIWSTDLVAFIHRLRLRNFLSEVR